MLTPTKLHQHINIHPVLKLSINSTRPVTYEISQKYKPFLNKSLSLKKKGKMKMTLEGYILSAHALGLTTAAIQDDFKARNDRRITELFIENILRAAWQQPRRNYGEDDEAATRFIILTAFTQLEVGKNDTTPEETSCRMRTRGFPRSSCEVERIGELWTKAADVHTTLKAEFQHVSRKWKQAVVTAYKEFKYTINEIVDLSSPTEVVSSQVISVIRDDLGISAANQRQGHAITNWDDDIESSYLLRFVSYGFQIGLTIQQIKNSLNVHGYDFFLANSAFVVSLLQIEGILPDDYVAA